MADELKSCPTIDQLKALVDSSQPEDQQVAIQAHVDGCTMCQKQLESLVAGSESWDAALDHLRSPVPRSEETILSDAMKRMKADEFPEGSGLGSRSMAPTDFLTPSDKPGSIGRLGSYEVIEVVGQGGMGIVLKAFDPALHRVVAVKVLAPYLAHNPQARKRFIREAQAIAAVSHDHVITIHAIDESPEQPKIFMQFVAGQSLQHKIDAEGSLDLKEILRIGMQTASGLAAAHAQGLVHRDVKPSNILLENGIQRVKLTDFGLARAVDDASLTQSGVIAGTPQYMAPEQANGDAVDYRADLFSLGSVLYAMCVGHSPFRASTTMGVLKRVCHDPPRPIQELNPDIPDWLCAIVMKLLEKKPEDRFATAKSVADLLEKWLAHVQQPMMVAKPLNSPSEPIPVARQKTFDQSENPALEPILNPEKLKTFGSKVQTELFRLVPQRWLLFFFLFGAAVMMAMASMERPNEEAIFVGLIGGVVTCFWVIIFAFLGRLIWSNLFGELLTNKAASFDDPQMSKSSGNSPKVPIRKSPRLASESIALLTAIVVMLGAHPSVAFFAAIIAWVAASLARGEKPWKSNQRDSMHTTDASIKAFSDSVPRRRIWSTQQLTRFNSVWHGLAGGAREFWDAVKSLFLRTVKIFDPVAPSMCRLLLTIGWCLVGSADFLWMFFLISYNPWYPVNHTAASAEMVYLQAFLRSRFEIFVAALAMFLISFAVANSIYVRQNLRFIKIASFIGLVPLSLGSIIRIPISIVTLFWLEAEGTRASFETTPWPETQLGDLILRPFLFVRRSFATTIWLTFWSVTLFTSLYAISWVVNPNGGHFGNGLPAASLIPGPNLFSFPPNGNGSLIDQFKQTWMSTMGGLMACLIWLIGMIVIVRRRHFRRIRSN